MNHPREITSAERKATGEVYEATHRPACNGCKVLLESLNWALGVLEHADPGTRRWLHTLGARHYGKALTARDNAREEKLCPGCHRAIGPNSIMCFQCYREKFCTTAKEGR
jgi:hypothetical protein